MSDVNHTVPQAETTNTGDEASRSCCTPARQAVCCEPSEKASCCGPKPEAAVGEASACGCQP